MTENQRLKIIRNELRLTQQQLADAVGLKQGSYADVERGKVKVSGDIKRKLEKEFSINIDWLENGLGEMLNTKTNKTSMVLSDVTPYKGYSEVSDKRNEFIGVPMYNIPASASLVEMYGDANDVKIVGHLTIPGATKDSFALPVHGHSMYPTLENGSWCVLRPLTDKTDIEWGEIYYIEYGDYRMYKRLLKADDEDSVILWSDNQTEIINNRPKYSAKTIKKEKIRRLCLLTDILKKPNY